VGYAIGVSGSVAVVGFQQSAQTLNANDVTLTALVLRLDDPVEALLNPLMMIVANGADDLWWILEGKDYHRTCTVQARSL
jgi:acylphosphatase